MERISWMVLTIVFGLATLFVGGCSVFNMFGFLFEGYASLALFPALFLLVAVGLGWITVKFHAFWVRARSRK